MQNRSGSADTPKVRCEVCLKDIPVSEAQSAEAQDYVAYFCGLDCYDQWKAQNQIHGGKGKRKR